MKLNPVPEHIANAGLRMVKTICSEAQQLSELQIQFIAGIQKHLLQTDFALDELAAITPQELASLDIAEEFKYRMIRGGIIAACIDGEMRPEAVDRLQSFAEALRVDLAPVHTARKLADHNLLLARFDIIRRSLPGVKIGQTIRNESLLAMIKQMLPLAGVELPEVTEKYKKLKDYPEGTLGKEFIHYIERNHFPLPGEKGAGPEIIVLHDCLHILGNYGTSPSEEIEIASFQAGCQFEDPIYGLLFGLAQYHLNIQVAPVAPSQGFQARPEKMIAAFARGCKVNRDMWRDFVPWEHFHQPVESLRDMLGLETVKKTRPES